MATETFGSLIRAHGLVGAIRHRLFGPVKKVARGEDPRRADRVIGQLLMFGFAVMLVLILYGLWIPNGVGSPDKVDNVDSMHFIGWALAAGAMAIVSGGALGALFGLPTARLGEVRRIVTVELPGGKPAATSTSTDSISSQSTEQGASGTSANNSAQSGNDARRDAPDMPYNESTSLEQIADWLTKIIVGLTLTQYASWEGRFETLSRNLTSVLYNREGAIERCIAALPKLAGDARAAAAALCDIRFGSAMPGAIILVTYALIGVMVGYLWMRRHFITEMVIARRNAENALLAESERQRSEAEIARAQAAAAAVAEGERLRSMADVARAQAAADAAEAARKKAVEEAVMAKAETEKTKSETVKAKADAELKTLEVATKTAEIATTTAAAQAEADRKVTELTAFQAELEAMKLGGIAVEASQSRSPATADSIGEIARNVLESAPVDSEARKFAQSIIDAPEPAFPDDPWRGRLGGASENSDFRLEARISSTRDPVLFEVVLTVVALTDERKAEVAGQSVQFLLHPAFGSASRTANFADGTATLKLFAYGAFTAGALTENGPQLELNLATVALDPELQMFLQR